MCTVTFIPVQEGFFLTSNRDEQHGRPPALAPHMYDGTAGSLLFPKDTLAGGTWFAAHEKGHVGVLLNGAWQKHVSRPPYRASRGVVLLELMDHPAPSQGFQVMDLEGIEPFTLVLAEEGFLHEFRWDGTTKFHCLPDAALPHIWSSVTLYAPKVIKGKEQKFHTWLQHHGQPTIKEIFDLHRGADSEDPRDTFLLDREGKLLTVSITLLRHTAGSPMYMQYMDIPGGQTFYRTFLTPATPSAV